MVYITNANANLIKDHLINPPINANDLYKKEIVFLSDKEKEYLLRYRFLCEHVENISEFYEKISPKTDKYTYVFESKNSVPVYHKNKYCPKLNADFINYKIPDLIKDQWEDSVNKYRAFFKEHQELLEKDPDLFLMRVNNQFNVDYQSTGVIYLNTWVEDFDNISLTELESKIDFLIEDEAKIYNNPEVKDPVKEALRRYRLRSFLYKPWKEITDNDVEESGVSNELLKKLLKKYEEKYKIPLKRYLQEYYRIRFNPDLKFEWTLLDQIWFKKCKHCYQSEPVNIEANNNANFNVILENWELSVLKFKRTGNKESQKE